jgi:NAD-dependent deacetylase
VIALHGSLMHARCSAGCPGRVELSDETPVATIPPCEHCGARLRPDVVWFGEPLPVAEFETARNAAVACDVFVSVGTSNLVEPAASLPWLAASHGATVIVVNSSMQGQRKGPSILPIEGPAAVMLPRLVEEAFAGRRARPRA